MLICKLIKCGLFYLLEDLMPLIHETKNRKVEKPFVRPTHKGLVRGAGSLYNLNAHSL